MSKIHLEILDTVRIRLFEKLRVFSSVGYLAGGTSLALQIGHRKSVDFDIFLPKQIDNSLRQRIQSSIDVEKYILNTDDQITVSTTDTISVTFLWYYFPLLEKSITTPYMPLASVIDIAADKAMTIGRRALWRDYVDIYFLLKDAGLTLASIVEYAQNKFGREFIISQFLEQLVYYDDLIISPIDYIGPKVEHKTIEDYLQQSVARYIERMP